MRKLILPVIGLVVIVLVARTVGYRRGLQPLNAQDTTRTVVTIPTGASTAQIAQLLEEKDVIRSAKAFRRFVREEGVDGRLQAGSFVVLPSMSVAEVARALTGGSAQEAIVTIPEGLTVAEIDALLAEKGLTAAGELTACARTCDFSSFTFLPDASGLAQRGGALEGYLYPDTYFVVATDFDVKAFLDRLLTTFRTRVVEGRDAEIRASGRSLHDVVIMASLIEKETRTNDERPVVSGILWKRLDEGIGLGVDAAVRYILEKPTAPLTRQDLDVDSPYNLRRYRGLTPGPIANAGMRSIDAALRPQESPYYYYLHGIDGVIRYARTNDEHNANKARYLR